MPGFFTGCNMCVSNLISQKKEPLCPNNVISINYPLRTSRSKCRIGHTMYTLGSMQQ